LCGPLRLSKFERHSPPAKEAVVTGWTAQAGALADAIREPGSRAAGVTASAWRAGVHPEATHGIVGAAMALTSGDAMESLWAQVEPCPKDTVLLEHTTELEGAAAELLKHADGVAAACEQSLEAAVASAQQAAAADPAKDPGAAGRLAAARAEIADCEAALEILGQARAALGYALKCLRQVPDDFAQHYEIPKTHVRHQGPLPVSGGFLTPV